MTIPISALYQAKLASPMGLFRLVSALITKGSNLMVLLEVAAKNKGEQIALAEGVQTITYAQLYQESRQLAAQWYAQGIQAQQKVGLIGRNHRHLVTSLFALSSLGVDCFLIPTALPSTTFQTIIQQQKLEILVYDKEENKLIEASGFRGKKWLFKHEDLPNVQALIDAPLPRSLTVPRVASGRLVTLSGGTTGTPQSSSRQPSLGQFLAPFFALLRQFNLQRYQSTYIATPLYHGFGLAALLVSVALGATICLLPKFDKELVFKLLLQQKVQVWVTVPTILKRLIQGIEKGNLSTKLILSGGAPLPSSLIKQLQQFPTVQLANLYGTSEAGFCILANGNDLSKYPSTIGKAIQGARLRLVTDTGQVVAQGAIGQLHVCTTWRAQQAQSNWVNTDDFAYQNKEGYYFLCGRQSDRVVSGGVNVYPLVVEQLLETHPAIEQVAVLGVPNAIFGECLAAYIVLTEQKTVEELKKWLQQRASKEQIPKHWYFLDTLPLTSLGKLDKKRLLQQ